MLLAYEHTWRSARGGKHVSAPRFRPRSRYVLAIPLLLALEAAAWAERRMRPGPTAHD